MLSDDPLDVHPIIAEALRNHPGPAFSAMVRASAHSILRKELCNIKCAFSDISKPVVCQTYDMHVGGLSRNDGDHKTTKDDSDS